MSDTKAKLVGGPKDGVFIILRGCPSVYQVPILPRTPEYMGKHEDEKLESYNGAYYRTDRIENGCVVYTFGHHGRN